LTKKQGKKKSGVTWLTRRVDPADPARPGQDPVTNPLTFVFLLKRRRFDFFFKELTRPTRSNPMTRSKPKIRTLNRADHRAGS
jgi:hypothetical protein